MLRLDRFLTLYFFGPLFRRYRAASDSAVSILMYHSISDDPEPGVLGYYRIATPPDRFREQMGWLHEQGYAVLNLAEALRRLEAKALDLDRCVVLTFDDGYLDFKTHAWPILAEFGFTATMFLPTAFIGNGRKSFNGRECLTWTEVRELQGYGVSFGSHTVSHSVLYDLPWRKVRGELLDSRLRLEDELQAPVHEFAYPYAFPQEDRGFVARFKLELRDQGYRAAVTTMIGQARRGGDSLCLKRLLINGCDDKRLFMAKLAGTYDWMAEVQRSARRLKFLVRCAGFCEN
jgi:peptidoglycan/xylan/chitin deacetylase (PgdA/CDA1 family)